MFKVLIWFLPIFLLLTGCDSSTKKTEKKAKEIGLLQVTSPVYDLEQLNIYLNQEMADRSDLNKIVTEKYNDNQSLMTQVYESQKIIQKLSQLPYLSTAIGCNRMLCVLINQHINLLTAAQKDEIIKMLIQNQQQLKHHGKEAIIYFTNLAWSYKDSKPLIQPHVDFWVPGGKYPIQRRSYKSGDEVKFLNDVMDIYSHYDDYFNGTPYPKQAKQLEINTQYFDCYYHFIYELTPAIIDTINDMNQCIKHLQESIPAEK